MKKKKKRCVRKVCTRIAPAPQSIGVSRRWAFGASTRYYRLSSHVLEAHQMLTVGWIRIEGGAGGGGTDAHALTQIIASTSILGKWTPLLGEGRDQTNKIISNNGSNQTVTTENEPHQKINQHRTKQKHVYYLYYNAISRNILLIILLLVSNQKPLVSAALPHHHPSAWNLSRPEIFGISLLLKVQHHRSCRRVFLYDCWGRFVH